MINLSRLLINLLPFGCMTLILFSLDKGSEQRLKAEEQYIKQNEVISKRDNLYSITLTSTINENDYYLVNIISDDKINMQKLDIKCADICLCVERDEQPYMETFIKGSGTDNEHIEKIELHIPKEDNEKFKIY